MAGRAAPNPYSGNNDESRHLLQSLDFVVPFSPVFGFVTAEDDLRRRLIVCTRSGDI
jgi:hypothetical protein